MDKPAASTRLRHDEPTSKTFDDRSASTPGRYGWPALLSRELLCEYLGIGASSLAKVCPVQPLDLGLRMVRYHRPQIDAWLETFPHSMLRNVANENGEVANDAPDASIPSHDRLSESLSRVRKRARSKK
jgi:hypothetical protein